MSIQPDAPGEIYEDKNGDRWIVISMCREPTVTMQRIDPVWHEGPVPFKQSGGISGLMWEGFKRIAEAYKGRVAP